MRYFVIAAFAVAVTAGCVSTAEAGDRPRIGSPAPHLLNIYVPAGTSIKLTVRATRPQEAEEISIDVRNLASTVENFLVQYNSHVISPLTSTPPQGGEITVTAATPTLIQVRALHKPFYGAGRWIESPLTALVLENEDGSVMYGVDAGRGDFGSGIIAISW